MNTSQFPMNFEMFPICQMGIKYRAIARLMSAKKKIDIPKSNTEFASNKKNAVTDKIDGIEQIR